MQAGIGGPAAPGYDDSLAEAGVLGFRAREVRVDLNAMIRRANLLASSFEEAMDSLASHNQQLEATPSIIPTQGWLSSGFSRILSGRFSAGSLPGPSLTSNIKLVSEERL